jgi:hypothetical protein
MHFHRQGAPAHTGRCLKVALLHQQGNNRTADRTKAMTNTRKNNFMPLFAIATWFAAFAFVMIRFA